MDSLTLKRRTYIAVNAPPDLAPRFDRPILVETWASDLGAPGEPWHVAFRFVDPETGKEARDGVLVTCDSLEDFARLMHNAARIATMHFADLAIRADELAGRALVPVAPDEATAILDRAFPEGLS